MALKENGLSILSHKIIMLFEIKLKDNKNTLLAYFYRFDFIQWQLEQFVQLEVYMFAYFVVMKRIQNANRRSWLLLFHPLQKV